MFLQIVFSTSKATTDDTEKKLDVKKQKFFLPKKFNLLNL